MRVGLAGDRLGEDREEERYALKALAALPHAAEAAMVLEERKTFFAASRAILSMAVLSSSLAQAQMIDALLGMLTVMSSPGFR